MDVIKIKEMAHQATSQNGCRIYDFYRHKDRLQFLIDKSEEQVSLKDCENVFHSLKFLIETEYPEVLNQKRLEISTPGMDKKLREQWHFEEALHQAVKVVTSSPVSCLDSEKQKTVHCQTMVGELISVSSDEISLKDPKRQWMIPFSKIKLAHVVLPIEANNKKRGKKNV
ncbi:MAG: ribosome maturation factor RimP [Bdellovibrionales bacterium]